MRNCLWSNDVPGDIELLAVSIRPYYLPREFSHVIAITTYIPPSANAAAACELLHSVVAQLQTEHPQAFLTGDFNHASLSATLPNFLPEGTVQEYGKRRNPEPGDRDWANKLNLFFNRFDTGPTSTPLSLSTDQPTSSSLCLHAPSPPSTPPPSLGLSPSPPPSPPSLQCSSPPPPSLS
ncbi:hypothetical protein L3Q82_009739 [Scortum barcoo]|uniref:Uncharacterized protein n=1 Tax=Scortum barcoo TaxID=214431 RepID=A0ACB8WEH6_9TELE|nr:hypothetical protein L3Q82_009739 [Scortum barcoo]